MSQQAAQEKATPPAKQRFETTFRDFAGETTDMHLSELAQSSFGKGSRLFARGTLETVRTDSLSPTLCSQNSLGSNRCDDRGFDIFLELKTSLEQHRLEILSCIQELRKSQEDVAEKLHKDFDEKVNKLEHILQFNPKSLNAHLIAKEDDLENSTSEEVLTKVLHEEYEAEVSEMRHEGHKEPSGAKSSGQEYLSQHAQNAKKMLSEPLLQRKEGHRRDSTNFAGLTNCLSRMVHSVKFDAITGVAIVLNAIFMGYCAEKELKHFEQDVEDERFIKGLTAIFNTFFIVELCLRLSASGWHSFFCGPDRYWNIADFTVVGSTMGYLLASYFVSSSLINPSIFRVLRLFRIVRIVKVARVAYFLHELRNMVASLAGGMRILLWSIILLSMIYYTFSMVILTAIADRLADHSTDPEWVKTMMKFYGSISEAMLTLYMATTGGMDWSEAANPLMVLGGGYYMAYLFFNAFVSMALLNVITGSFVDATMKASLRDYVQEMQEESEDFHMYRQSVLEFFHLFDDDSDGLLDLDELQQSFAYPVMNSFLRHVGYHRREAETLFRAMDQATGGRVYVESFVDSCLRLGRAAKGLDMLLMMDQLHLVQETITRMEQESPQYKKPKMTRGFSARALEAIV